METGDGTLTKHAMTLDVNDVESGGFVIMQRPEIWSRPNANSPYTLESAGVWESQMEVNTPNDFCWDNSTRQYEWTERIVVDGMRSVLF